MPACTVAILTKGTSIVNIVDVIESKYNNVIVHSYSHYFFQITFDVDTYTTRTISVSLTDSCFQDYGISGTLISLGNFGNSVEIIKNLCETFGGYFKENDCSDSDFEELNLQLYLNGKVLTERDLFIQEIIYELGYSNLKNALVIFDKYIKL